MYTDTGVTLPFSTHGTANHHRQKYKHQEESPKRHSLDGVNIFKAQHLSTIFG
jgi:hypothetical protein